LYVGVLDEKISLVLQVQEHVVNDFLRVVYFLTRAEDNIFVLNVREVAFRMSFKFRLCILASTPVPGDDSYAEMLLLNGFGQRSPLDVQKLHKYLEFLS